MPTLAPVTEFKCLADEEDFAEVSHHSASDEISEESGHYHGLSPTHPLAHSSLKSVCTSNYSNNSVVNGFYHSSPGCSSVPSSLSSLPQSPELEVKAKISAASTSPQILS